MATVEGYEVPDDLYYHKEHVWAKVEGEEATVGLTDFTQKLAGEISYIEMPEEGGEIKQDEVIGTIETGKWLGKLYAPLSGQVTAVNEEVDDDPTIINSDPYGKGWVFKMKIKDTSELSNLMKGEASHGWLRGEIKKHTKEKK